ncbi:MAG: thioredoxin domain-containing protein, partial [Candidatus Woesearchaeota archaeon]
MSKSKNNKKESKEVNDEKSDEGSFLESKISNLLFFVLGMLLVTVFLLLFNVNFGSFSESGLNNETELNDVITEQEASEKVASFLTELTGSEISSLSVQDSGSLYEVTVSYQGQEIPVYITKDGERFIEQAISIEEGVQQQNNQQQETADLQSSQIENEPYLGDEDAPVTIVEFSDYNCPYCKRHYDQTKPSIKENYVEEGLVKYVFMDFVGVGSPVPHEASRCVRELGG